MFTQFDKDRDGLLDVSDLGPLLRSMGPSHNPSEKELEELKLRFLPLGKGLFTPSESEKDIKKFKRSKYKRQTPKKIFVFSFARCEWVQKVR